MNKFVFPAGSVMIFRKRKSCCKRLLDFLLRRKTEHELEVKIAASEIELLTYEPERWEIFVPRKSYTKQEINKLKNINPITEQDIIAAINIIRPNTIRPAVFTLESFSNNGYYKKANAIEY